MHILKKIGALVLPIGATLAMGSYAAADSLSLYFGGTDLADGASAYACSNPSSSGLRAHIQAYGEAKTSQPNFFVTDYNLASGTTHTTALPSQVQGTQNRARLQRHLLDTSTGEENTQDLCDGGWKPWGTSSSCSTNVASSPNSRARGAEILIGCGDQRTFTATSQGND